MIMLIRSMAPQVIAVDEIGAQEDVHAIEYAMHCGCKMLATAHGYSMEEIQRKPIFEKLVQERRFERYVILSNRYQIGGIEQSMVRMEACSIRKSEYGRWWKNAKNHGSNSDYFCKRRHRSDKRN